MAVDEDRPQHNRIIRKKTLRPRDMDNRETVRISIIDLFL